MVSVAYRDQSANDIMVVSELVISNRVGSLPHISYIPDYVKPDEEERILGHVYASKTSWTKVYAHAVSDVRAQAHSCLACTTACAENLLMHSTSLLLLELHVVCYPLLACSCRADGCKTMAGWCMRKVCCRRPCQRGSTRS